MPVNENTIIDYLAEKYGSSISKRALWSWCGGAEADVIYDLPPLDGWGLMWEKSGEHKAPSRIGLVREMLFDSPGEKVLLGYLGELAAERFKTEKGVADFFLFLLARTGATEHRLAALLYLLQDIPPDCVLATTAPAIQAARDDTLYVDLEKILPQFVDEHVTLTTGILVEWIEFYLECFTDDMSVVPVTLEKVGQAQKLLSKLKALVINAAASEKTPSAANLANAAADDKDTDKLEEREAAFKEITDSLRDHIEDLKTPPSESGPGFFIPAVTVVASLLELLSACGLGGEMISLRLSAAEPVRAALWATR